MPPGAVNENLWLPPPDARLINPEKEKIKTPIDERGLIDTQKLISEVKATIDTGFEWPTGLSIHHLYWPKFWYNEMSIYYDSDCPRTFRELPIHKALLPRVFENWLHLITTPPEIPSSEVMHYRLEAWQVAKSLFQSARNNISHQKLAKNRRSYIKTNPSVLKAEFNGVDCIGEEYIASVFEKNFRSLEEAQQQNESIPAEFRLIETDMPTEIIARNLGKLVVPQSMRLVRAVMN